MPKNAAQIKDIPDDFQPAPLGLRKNVIDRILKIIPNADFSDPTWGNYESDEFSIEFNMGGAEICEGFMLHVRGGGNAPLLIDFLLKEMDLRAFDCSTGDFFKLDEAKVAYQDWQEFRDKNIEH